ncbi:MAG: EAL domain-containing protein [Gammaproteobacteria bacterium]|nr:EAL domain-containing protein [Gammaproteobacteria bacterium]
MVDRPREKRMAGHKLQVIEGGPAERGCRVALLVGSETNTDRLQSGLTTAGISSQRYAAVESLLVDGSRGLLAIVIVEERAALAMVRMIHSEAEFSEIPTFFLTSEPPPESHDVPGLQVLSGLGGEGLLLQQLGLMRDLVEAREDLAEARLHMSVADNVLSSMIDSRNRTEMEHDRFRAVVDSALDGVIMLAADTGRFIYANHGACTILGFGRAQLLAMSVGDLVATYPAESLTALLKSVRRGVPPSRKFDSRVRRRDDRDIAVSVFLQFIPEAAGPGLFICFISDITDRVEQTRQLEYQSLHDPLTALPNRVLFNDRLQHAISEAERQGSQLELLMMDLDRFKEVNDTLGHHVGDMLLQHVANCIKSVLRASDSVARLGGDEFGVILVDVETRDAVVGVARKIAEAIGRPYLLEGHRLEVGVSIGIAGYPDSGQDAATLMRRADVAMYTAKRNQVDFAFYNADQDEHSLLMLTLESELRQGIAENQLVLHYQPKIAVESGEILGVEALVRWNHPSRGMVPPDAFIAAAERSGLIHSLTAWVIDRATAQCAEWRASGHPLKMALNISARNIEDDGLPRALQSKLLQHGLPADALELEVTESDIMIDSGRATEVMRILSGAGVGFSVDDFGTGYSSLAYLKRLPVSVLKIDRSFVAQMVRNGDDMVIVHSTINMAHNLGLKVVAEGVEDKETLDLLQVLKCDLAQGYYISGPLPAEELVQWLTNSASNGCFKRA